MKSRASSIITSQEYREMYRDQIAVIGEEGQERLRRSRVHVSGLGGIGSHVVLHLAEAGVGHITANDPQSLELSNLSRWPLGGMADLGMPKVDILRSFLARHPSVGFEALEDRSESPLVVPMLRSADLIVCCSNTLSSRVATIQAAIKWDRPLLDVGVADGRRALFGAVRIYNPHQKRYACPACFIRLSHRVRRNEGLLSTVVASTATVAAHLAISILSADGRLDVRRWGSLVVFDFEQWRIENLHVLRRGDCEICK